MTTQLPAPKQTGRPEEMKWAYLVRVGEILSVLGINLLNEYLSESGTIEIVQEALHCLVRVENYVVRLLVRAARPGLARDRASLPRPAGAQ